MLLRALSVLFITLTLRAASDAVEPVWKASPGPWGDLEIRTAYLEPPDSLLAVVAKPNSVTRWTFEQTNEQGVRALLVKAGVTEPLLGRLLNPARMVASGTSFSLYPEVADLVAIPSEARNVIYTELAKYPSNEYQRDPVFIIGQDPEDWLTDSSLSSDQRVLFRKLLWQRGKALVFSDINALLTLARNQEEVQSVFRSVTRVRTLIVTLKLPVKGDTAAFMDFWSGHRSWSPRLPFLTAVTHRRAPQSIDVTHFLPSLMRQKVYTFPEIEQGLKGRFPDCHWTSLNFFSPVPKDFLLDTRLAASYLMENYTPVDPPYNFGDVLCFLDNGEGLHSCVYIADDIIFTKNGDSILAPWVLMQIKDVESIYRRSENTRVQGYRLKR